MKSQDINIENPFYKGLTSYQIKTLKHLKYEYLNLLENKQLKLCICNVNNRFHY